MSELRVLLKPRDAALLVLILIGMIAALVYALSSSDEPIHSQATDRQRIESDDPLVQRTGSWTTQTAPEASGGSYLYSSGSQEDALTLTFSGNYIEVVFVSGPNLAMLALDVDNTVRRTVVTAADQSHYNQQAIIDYLETGPHTLKVYAQEGGVIAVDAFVVGITEPDEVSNLPQVTPTLSEMEATQTMDALLATVDKSKLGDAVIAEAQAKGMVWVSVGLVEPQVRFSTETMDDYKSEIADMQDQILESISNQNYEIADRFATAGFYMKADLTTLIILQSNPFVSRIVLGQGQTGTSLDSPVQTALLMQEVHNVLRDDDLRDIYGVMGDDIVIAVLDSGVDPDHPALSDDIILMQQCFNRANSFGDAADCPPNNTATGNSALDEYGHGTRVTGIITANDGTYEGTSVSSGVAPHVKIVAIRVNNSQNRGERADTALALNWIITNQSVLQVDFVNMSFGSGPQATSGQCDAFEDANILSFTIQLYNMGVRFFAASGNNGNPSQIHSPACQSRVYGVGSTYDSNYAVLNREPDTGNYPGTGCFDDSPLNPPGVNTVACFTNRSTQLDYLAPGVRIVTTHNNGGILPDIPLNYNLIYGTSFSTPMVSAIAALVEEVTPGIAANNLTDFEAALNYGSTTLAYPDTGTQYFGLLVDAYDAARRYLPDQSINVPPTNDELGAAQTIPTLPYKRIQDVYQSNYNAASDPNPASNGCFTQGYRNSVWYTYVSPSNQIVSVSTSDSTYDTGIMVYSYSSGNLIFKACAENGYLRRPAGTGPLPITQAELNFEAAGGARYYIIVVYQSTTDLTGPAGLHLKVSLDPIGEKLALFNPSLNYVSAIDNLQNTLTLIDYSVFPGDAAGGAAPPINANNQWVMGDWNGDGIDTPGVYATNGVFYLTNNFGSGSDWIGVWFGLFNKPAVAGQFAVNYDPPVPPNPTTNPQNDCVGVIDNGVQANGDMGYVLYFICNFEVNDLRWQWLGTPLPNSQGFSGPHQFAVGDFFVNDGIETIAVRRGPFITWTDTPATTLLAQMPSAQYIGNPDGDPDLTNGYFVAGRWNSTGSAYSLIGDRASFGLLYPNGTFYYRRDLDWNSGVYLSQSIGQPIGPTGITAVSWQPH